ncbi:hypothetical protein, partial [Ureibacillus thermosphaericus]|uniref:hypothetical protein n=1 Tax=Ureibacillus thermosphaericus TaxID=51173 RepID=UPI0030C9EBBA
IPRHHGHPCSWLTSTSVFGVRDLHPIVHVHAGRTKRKSTNFGVCAFSFGLPTWYFLAGKVIYSYRGNNPIYNFSLSLIEKKNNE